MSYESPIKIMMDQIHTEIEDGVLKAVYNTGINIDKAGLISALTNGFAQYSKGYRDRDEDIIRCKDCMRRDPEDHRCDCGHDIQWQLPRQDNWFCADGIRR